MLKFVVILIFKIYLYVFLCYKTLYFTHYVLYSSMCVLPDVHVKWLRFACLLMD